MKKKLTHNNHKAWLEQGNKLFDSEHYEKAMADYDKAIQIKPDYYEAWFNRGLVLYELGHYQETLASYDKAIQFKPDYYNAWFNRAALLANEFNHYKKALVNYDFVIQLKPDSYLAWSYRGRALVELGDYEEALASYDKAIQLEPNYHNAWFARFKVLYNKLGRRQEAIAGIIEFIELNPELAKKQAQILSQLPCAKTTPFWSRIYNIIICYYIYFFKKRKDK